MSGEKVNDRAHGVDLQPVVQSTQAGEPSVRPAQLISYPLHQRSSELLHHGLHQGDDAVI